MTPHAPIGTKHQNDVLAVGLGSLERGVDELLAIGGGIVNVCAHLGIFSGDQSSGQHKRSEEGEENFHGGSVGIAGTVLSQ